MILMPRSSTKVIRYALIVGLSPLTLGCLSPTRVTANDFGVLHGLDPLTAPVSVLHARIERETTKAARSLSPDGRRVMNGSMHRFFAWAEGNCDRGASCLRNQFINYLVAVPGSVYLVGQWTVYSTGVYALEWADEDLQRMDSGRAFIWSFQLTWPRVDTTATLPLEAVTLAEFANDALAARMHEIMAFWVKGGWERSLDVHLEGLDDCYVSASIAGDTYSGGAHPYEDFSTFNWNVRAKRALQNADLFRTDTDWKSGILALYRTRLRTRGIELSEWALSSDGVDSMFTNGFVITDHGLRFVEHQGATRMEVVPAINLAWDDLAPWLIPGAVCP